MRSSARRAVAAVGLLCALALVAVPASPLAAPLTGAGLSSRGAALGARAAGSGYLLPAAAFAPALWTGTAKGGVFIQRNGNSSNLVIEDQQNYQATFNFSFQLQNPGLVAGDGNGTYDQATWHLQGTYDNQSFSCDPQMTADPFTVAVGGTGANRTLNLSLDLPDAVESNADTNCGANFTAFGSRTQYLRASLEAVEQNGVKIDMTNPASVTLTNQTRTNSSEFQDILKDSSWTFSIQHPCAKSNYSDPATSGYINQYDAGANLMLPVSSGSSGVRGGNACGPSSLVMLVNALKEWSGSATRMDLKQIYKDTMANGWTADGQDNEFDWVKASGWAKSKGYDVTLGDGISFIDGQLSGGAYVLASTLFSSKAASSTNPYGGGHVVLFTGRTANGDYIVDDPAGDYFATDSGHYGSGKCGSDTIYPQKITDDRLYNDDGSTRPALAIRGLGTGDPAVLVVIGWFNATGPSPFDLTVTDAQGERAGFLADGTTVQEILGSEARLDPQYPSDPAAPSMHAPNQTWWPQAIVVPLSQDPSGYTISVTGRSAADYRVETYWVDNGTTLQDTNVAGHVAANQSFSFPVQSAAANSFPVGAVVGIVAVGGIMAVAVSLWVRRRKGRPPMPEEPAPGKTDPPAP